MANVFAIITAILLVVSAFLAFKNKGYLEEEVKQVGKEQRSLALQQDNLRETQSTLETTQGEDEGVKGEIVKLQAEEKQLTDSNAEIKKKIDDTKALVDQNKAKLDDIKDQTKDAGKISELAANIKRLGSEIQDMRDEKAIGEASLANRRSEQASTEETIKQYEEQNSSVANKRSFFSSARITGIYGAFGFVTIGAGNSQGVVSGSRLNVMRGGEKIAQLQVSSVESNASSADIVPDSKAEDVTLTVGDQVVPADAN